MSLLLTNVLKKTELDLKILERWRRETPSMAPVADKHITALRARREDVLQLIENERSGYEGTTYKPS